MSPLTFRYEVQPEDCRRVRELVASTGVFSAIEEDVAVELVEDRLAHGAASDYRFLFAERAGTVLGYTCYGPIPLTSGSYDLYWIAVQKAIQGQKIGQSLMDETERLILAAEGRQVYIETSNRSHYAPTRSFYLRNGYQQVALLKDFYAPGDDKVIYWRALAPPR
jgi:ribosomal protein S18 acetylase RimI-like enzyme